MTTNFYVSNPDVYWLRQWSQELIGDLAKQTVDIYRPDLTQTEAVSEGSYDSFYGEVTSREDYRMYKWENVECFIETLSPELVNQRMGIDHKYGLTLYFDTDYINSVADTSSTYSDILVREGDFIEWEDRMYEVKYANKENRIFGLSGTHTQLRVDAVNVRYPEDFTVIT